LNRIAKIIKGLFLKFIPLAYRENSSIVKSIYKWFLIGFLIRLTFMPFTLHQDILSVYRRALLSLNGELPWICGPETVIRSFHIFFLWIFRPLVTRFATISNIMRHRISYPWEAYFKLIYYPEIYRTLFLFKLPYLIFDLGCALLLLKIFADDKRKGIYAWKFWMVNPVVIFSVFIFGRYESIALFFILLSLYYAKNNLNSRALFSLGISIIIRTYPLILLPFFILLLGKKLKEYVKLAFWGISPFVALTVLNKMFHQPGGFEGIAEMHHSNYLLGMRFNLGYMNDLLFVFVTGYTFLLLFMYFKTNHSFENLRKSSLILFLIFFATCVFHPQYFIWLVPFLTWQIIEDKRLLRLFILQCLCFVVYTFHWKQYLAGYLFAPLDPYYFIFHLNSPFDFINKYYPASDFINIFRSIFSGISLFMGYLVFKNLSLIRQGREE